MKFEKVNDNKIKITLNMDDLKANDIDFHSFMSNSGETESFFLAVLDKAEREQNQDSLAGLYALFLAPALTGAGKMMIDMTAFLVVFLASVHR